jgi:protein-S-isoprenylcysteine O-methyltransferase Ste14
MGRILGFLYGVMCYLIFLATFLYAIGFVGNIVVPKSIDTGVLNSPLSVALVIDALLLSLFAVQHSVMARGWFKRAWTRFVPPFIERSTYVLIASIVLLLLFWQWRPMGPVVWDVANPTARTLLVGLFWMGWGGVLFSTYLVDHYALVGLRQVYNHLNRRDQQGIPFKSPVLYKVVRHPLYLGFIIAFWSTPHMTFGHLFFAVMTTAYIVVAIQFEERDLIRSYGDTYRVYRQRVSMLIPIPRRR